MQTVVGDVHIFRLYCWEGVAGCDVGPVQAAFLENYSRGVVGGVGRLG
jgi:hypothetical protein